MNFQIGLSALRASQYAIENVSHNLANAETEGYHRQEAIFESRDSAFGRHTENSATGAGVDIAELRRFRSLITENSLTSAIADLSSSEQSVVIQSRIEALVEPGEGSIQNAINGLFDELTRISANPGENTIRLSALNQASNLAGRIQEASNQFNGMRSDIQQQLELEVQSLNRDVEELVELQNLIIRDVDGRVANERLDNRDQLINRIAEKVDIQRFEFSQNSLGISIAGSTVSLGSEPIRFETERLASGELTIQLEGGERPIKFASGSIASLLDSHNHILAEFGSKIDTLATEIISQFDQSHAVGIGPSGPFSSLVGTRSVTDIDLPLQESATFPIDPGQLFISVTSPTGERTTQQIEIDPAVDTLRDIADRINGLTNLNAVVDPATKHLAISAAGGFKFDFAGRLETVPNLGLFTGSSIPSLAGQYTGDINQTLSVTANTSGIVGKTPGLTLNVTDEAGTLLKVIDVGEDYEAGSAVDIGDGVTLNFSIGDVGAGDTFDVVKVAESDSSGVLSSLGINSLFAGTDASTIAIEQRLLDNPSLISTSRSGNIGDTSNLEGLIRLRNSRVLGQGQFTFESFLENVNSEIGFRVQSSQTIAQGLAELKSQYSSERDSISGVDINEELIDLTQHQKTYEAAIQVVRTMEAMMDDLFQIIR